MKALLLAGGLGTRLRPLTEHWPKPMALVANKPWLKHVVLQLKDEGIRDIVIAIKHASDIIQEYFGDGSRWGVRIEYSLEETLLGTAGAIKHAEKLLGDRFVVLNADIIQKTSIRRLAEFHEKTGALATIGLTEAEDPSHYGVVEQTGDGRVLRFVEKPPKHEAPSNRINAGIYVMEKEALAYIPPNREVSIERETFPRLIDTDRGVYGLLLDGYWLDMGTTQRYRKLHRDVLDRTFPLPLPGKEQGKGIWLGEDVVVGSGVLFVPPVLIGDRVQIGDRSVIGPYTVIGNDCVIGSQVRCTESILWDRCKVHHGAQLNHCIFGFDLELGANYLLHEAVMNRVPGGMSV